MPKEYKDLVVGLDIGTAKVMVVVAEVLPGGELRIAGLGSSPTHGLKRGVVVNIDATVQSIQQALKEAEMMADCKITRVYTGINTLSLHDALPISWQHFGHDHHHLGGADVQADDQILVFLGHALVLISWPVCRSDRPRSKYP